MAYFTGKHAVVTGAGSGIGRGLALKLNEQGCHLWLSDVDIHSLEETASALKRQDAACHTEVVDVADRESVERWATDIAAQVPAIDLLVNNAGVALMATAAETSYDNFHWLMNINFWGVVHGCKAFLPLLEQSEHSHLVNISSVFGMISMPTQSAYNAAKFAVRGYSESLRQELELAGSPVKLCCVHPGGIDTNIARRARSADPESTPDSLQESFAPHVRTSPTDAAAQILRAAERGKARLLIGNDARLIGLITRLFPVSYPRFFRSQIQDLQKTTP